MLNDREVLCRVEPAPLAGLLGERDQAHAIEHPAGDRQRAAVREVIEVVLEGFHRVEAVLGERVGAGRGRRPRVHERRLDHVVALGRPAHEAAAVLHGDAHVGAAYNPPENARNRSIITSRAMIGLISTPSTRRAPNTSADSRSRPPPGPMTSAENADPGTR